jgi:hypothetical protein
MLGSNPVPEFIDPRFRENKPKTLVFSHRKRAFWACFRENCVYNFGHRTVATLALAVRRSNLSARSHRDEISIYIAIYVCMYMYLYYINISLDLVGSLVSVGVGPWHGMMKGAGSNHLCGY